MKIDDKKAKKPYNHWWILVAFLIPFLNVETITLFFLSRNIDDYFIIFPICATVGVISLLLWYWFAGHIKKIDLIKEVKKLIDDKLQGKYGTSLLKRWLDKLDHENDKNKEAFSRIKVGGNLVGHFFVFSAALNPIPFISFIGWFPCILVCGWIKWRPGLIIMILGDILKNSIMTYLWITLGLRIWSSFWHLFI